jgi:hypothetical protein
MAVGKMTSDVVKFGPANPHPGFGKDPNIGNEYGHTVYPRFVEHKGEQIVVNTHDEFLKLGIDEEAQPEKKAPEKTKPAKW